MAIVDRVDDIGALEHCSSARKEGAAGGGAAASDLAEKQYQSRVKPLWTAWSYAVTPDFLFKNI